MTATQTLVSSVAPLCPVAQFLMRVDPSAIALLASDTPGVPVPSNNLATNPNVLAALADATGAFESAVMMGGKYSASDLQLLLTTTCGAQGMMFRIITDVAWSFLFERRPNMQVEPPPSMKRSMEWLDMLATGKRIFAFQQAQDATVLHKTDANAWDVFARNGAVVQAFPYYGKRSDEAIRFF